MLINFTTIVIFILASYTVGCAFLTVTGLTRKNIRCMPYMYAPVGVSIYSVTAAFVYFRLGLLISAVRITWAVMAITALIYLIARYIRNTAPSDRSLKTAFLSLKSLAFLLVLFCLMIVPGLKRGTNYYVYKGNVYDKFAYISEADYMVNHEATYGDYDMQHEEYFPDSLTTGYYYVVNDRPLASLVFAGVAYKGFVFFAGYLFINMMWAMISGPMAVIIESLFPKRKQWKYLVFSLIFIFGFFCQLQNDIDAWSQECGMSLLVAFTALWLITLKETLFNDKISNWRELIGLGLIGTGGFMVYGEATWVYGLVLVIMTLIMYTLTYSWNKYKELLKTASIPFMMLLFCLIAHTGTFICNFTHILFATATSNQGWTHFYKYWQGYHKYIASSHTGAVIKNICTIIPCWNGMYMLTPVYTGIPMPLIILWLTALFILSLGIIAIPVYSFIYIVRNVHREECFLRVEVLTAAILSTAFISIWLLSGQWLTASKSLMFVSPFTYLMNAMPVLTIVMREEPERVSTLSRTKAVLFIERGLLTVSALFILCQISALCLRLIAIKTNYDGVLAMGYYYPQMESDVKEGYHFTFDASKYADEDVVAVIGGDGYYQLYVKLCLTYYDIDYYTLYDWNGFDLIYDEDETLREGDTSIDVLAYNK